jgi:hypothetical protein
MTLAELLVATMVMTLVCTSLAVFTHTVMDNYREAAGRNSCSQTGRVLMARIGRHVGTSLRVLRLPDETSQRKTDDTLVLWAHDELEPLGRINFEELLIYTPGAAGSFLEIRPRHATGRTLDPADPGDFHEWLRWFRAGKSADVTTLVDDFHGAWFQINESAEPEGLVGLVQQNVQIGLCVSAADQPPTVYYGSATLRYPVGE